MVNADYLLAKSEECFALARQGTKLAEQLNAMGHSLMAKAVELDTDASRVKNRDLKKNKE